ncbi:hypothetical protein FACS1894141_1800 [Spirochaetia bacterium]|nr:hypothetical protein FACS1894141_1800 [Spirochaetia bacterium]
MKKIKALLTGIAAVVVFAAIVGCPARKETDRTPSSSVEYVQSKPNGSSLNGTINNTNKSYIDTNSKNEVENYLHGLGF